MKGSFSIKVLVPATTANLGPGFDVLGLALSHYNEVHLSAENKSGGPVLVVASEGEGEDSLPRDASNLVYKMVRRTLGKIGKKFPALHLRLVNRIPLARGLGSSSAAIVGGIVAANALCGYPLSMDEMTSLAVEEEGHPDNVVPAVAGGLCVSVMDGEKPVVMSWKDKNLFKGIRPVACIPSFELSTKKARSVLPEKVSRKDAIFNISRTALFLSAVKQKRWDLLGLAMEDKLHQTYRAELIPGFHDVVAAAKQKGAYAAFLSGAGPTVMAFSPEKSAEAVGKAMVAAFKSNGKESRSLILDFDFEGAKVFEFSKNAKN